MLSKESAHSSYSYPHSPRHFLALAIRPLTGHCTDVSLSPVTSFPHLPGTRPVIAGFELLSPAGTGGMGDVWKAIQTAEQRIVALKILRPPADPAPDALTRAQDRFRREIALAAQFDHPSLTRVLGSGTTVDGRLYAVLEWIEGEPVDQYVRTRSLPVEARLRLARALARGVQQLHERGFIHRDLKPANILITPAGEPKLLDFGLARTLDPTELGPTVSIAGELLGTPHFMSPEQAAGDTGRIGPPTDVWALGILLFHLATGEWPHAPGAPSTEVMARVLAADLPRPRQVAPRTPRDLDAVIAKCLQRDPSARYETAGGLAADLDRFLNHEPVSARPATLGYILGRTVRRHRAATMLSASLLVTAGIAIAWHSHTQGETNRRLQAALDEAMKLRSFLLLDLRWDFDRAGREDVLTDVARRARAFSAEVAASGLPRDPRFDPRRFEALAANLRGQAAAFRDNLSEALAEFRREYDLTGRVRADFPDDPLVALDSASSAGNVTALLLRLERPDEAVPLLEWALAVLAPVTPERLPPEATSVSLPQFRIRLGTLLARARREAGRAEEAASALARARSLLDGENPGGGPKTDLALAYAEVALEEARLARQAGRWQLALDTLLEVRPRLEDPALPATTRLAALATNSSETALARMELGQIDEAHSLLEQAEQHLIAMRQEGYFEPSMWRERQVARDAQTMAERLLRAHKADRADEFLRISVRLLQVRYHRPAAVRAVNADFIRNHALRARVRRQNGDLSGAAVSFNRAIEATGVAILADPDNPRWLIESANHHLSLAGILDRKPDADPSRNAAQLHARAAQLLDEASARPNLTQAQRQEIESHRARLPAPHPKATPTIP